MISNSGASMSASREELPGATGLHGKPGGEEGAAKVLVSVILFSSLLFLASTYFSIAVNSLSLGLMAIAWAGYMLTRREWKASSTPLDYYFLAYVLAEFLSLAFSVNRPQALLYSKRLLLIGIVYFFATWMREERDLKRAVAVLLGTASIVALFGVFKSFFGSADDRIRLGIFQFYMTTSELMMMALLLLLPFVLHPKTPARIRLLSAAGMIPVGISLYATVTRGAYLAAAAGIIFIAIVRHRVLLIPFLVLIVLLVLFAPPYVAGRLHSIVDPQHPENVSRVQMWTSGIRIWQEHPVVGVGDIDLGEQMKSHADPGYTGEWGHLHNILLNFLVTLGTVGFVVIVALFARIVTTEWNIYHVVKDRWFPGSVVLGALAVFVGFQVNGLVEWSFGDQEVVIILWVTVGFTLAVRNLRTRGGLAGTAS
jgi:O-antigen ligase